MLMGIDIGFDFRQSGIAGPGVKKSGNRRRVAWSASDQRNGRPLEVRANLARWALGSRAGHWDFPGKHRRGADRFPFRPTEVA
jgi:hypothetical protein